MAGAPSPRRGHPGVPDGLAAPTVGRAPAGTQGVDLRRGRDALRLTEPFLAERPLLLVTDFDGTLAHIVMDPWGARILPSARRALRRLAGAPGVHMTVLSARNAVDVACLTRAGGVEYLGDHGLQRGWLGRGRRAETLDVVPDPTFAAYSAEADRVASGVTRAVPEPWLIVEAKGPSVAFHYRSAPDVSSAGDRVEAAIEVADPAGRFARHRGRRIFEIRPPGAAAKGEAFRMLLDEYRPAVAIVLGDDRSDAEAFRVLRERRGTSSDDSLGGVERRSEDSPDGRGERRLRGLAIAVHAHPQIPQGVTEAADIVLASPVEAAAYLSALAKRIVS